MSSLPTNLIDGDPNHTTGHNNTNAQVNINSRPATVQSLVQAAPGTLTIDANSGHRVSVAVAANITEIVINNLTVGFPMLIIFTSVGPFTVDLSLFEAFRGSTLPESQPIDGDSVLMVETFLLNDGSFWVPDGLKDFDDAQAEPVEIDAADLFINIDAADTTSWGRDRTEGQWIIAANRFNAGANDDNIGPGLSGSDADGYNLSFNTAGDTVDGFTMSDAQTERIKPGLVGAIPVIELATQYDEDGSYVDQTPNSTNTAINRPPSDPLWFDRTMCGLDMLDTVHQFNVGPSGDTIRMSTAFIVEAWMAANDFTQGPFEFNGPLAATVGSPIRCNIQNGVLEVITRDSSTALISSSPTPSTETTQVSWTLPAVGQWAAFILDLKLDPGGGGYPGGGSGYLYLHSVNNTTGVVTQEGAAADANFGWVFQASENLNDEFWMGIMRFANGHSSGPSGITNNWDPVGGDVRRMKNRGSYITTNGLITVADHADHLRAKLGLPKP